MDWYSWLSKSNLDPSQVYEYGITFTRNEIKEEDMSYFNHEFLQSMGISVAKHRLEILKLARKEARVGPSGLLRFVMAINNKTKKLFARNIRNYSNNNNNNELVRPHRAHWSGALRKLESSKERAMIPSKKLLLNSGPLDRKIEEKITNRTLSASGPLDSKIQERLMLPSCSPLPWGSGKLKEMMLLDAWSFSPNNATVNDNHNNYKDLMKVDNGAHHSLWSLMFQDMKPT